MIGVSGQRQLVRLDRAPIRPGRRACIAPSVLTELLDEPDATDVQTSRVARQTEPETRNSRDPVWTTTRSVAEDNHQVTDTTAG
jgi:hypothetical protein